MNYVSYCVQYSNELRSLDEMSYLISLLQYNYEIHVNIKNAEIPLAKTLHMGVPLIALI